MCITVVILFVVVRDPSAAVAAHHRDAVLDGPAAGLRFRFR